MRKIFLALIALALASEALAQNAVTQFGTPSVNRPAKWVQQRVVGDAGGLTGDAAGKGLDPFSITTNNGLGVCFNSLPVSGTLGTTYHRWCLGHNASGSPIYDVDGTTYSWPPTGVGTGNIVGPATSTANAIPLWNNTTGTLVKDSGWVDDGTTRLLAPNNRSITVRGSGTFQAGGTIGPVMYSQAGFEDTMNIQAQPGALPSTNTTNLQLYPPSGGTKAYLNVTAQATLPNEERLIIGYNGASTYTFTSFKAAAGVAHPMCFIDGTGADITACFKPRSGGAGTYPFVDLGANVGIYGANSSVGQQEWLKMDSANSLVVAAGASIPTVILRKPISTVHTIAAGLSSCGGGTPTIAGDATAGFVTVGSGVVTACTVSFGITYGTAPRAILLTGLGTTTRVLSVTSKSTTGFVMASSADMAGLSFSYFVVQ